MVAQKIPLIRFLPGIAWFFIVGILTLMPGSDVPEIGWLDNIPNFDKLVHAAMFGGMTFLFCAAYFKSSYSHSEKRNIFIRITIAAIVWGITIEIIQKYFIPGRDFELLDWAADSLGAIIAFWLSMLLLRRMEKKEAQQTNF